MALTYSAALKTTRMTAVVTAIDGGGGAGYIEIGTAAMAAVLATIPFSVPCGTVAGAVLTMDITPALSVAATGAGTAAAARIRNFAATDIITGLTVGTSGTHVVLDNVVIAIGQVITLGSVVLTHA